MVVIRTLRNGRLAAGAALLLASLACGGPASAAGSSVSALHRIPVPGPAAPGKPADFMTRARSAHDTRGSATATTALPSSAATPASALAGTVVNTAVCVAAYDQSAPGLVPDGAGGGFVCWHDYRDGNLDVYAQRLDPQGVPLWTPDGTPVCKNTAMQWYPRAVADGTGGVIVVWQDARNDTTYDVYAQRLSADGVPLWAADGVAVCSQGASQLVPAVAADEVGGAVVVWTDTRNADRDLYAQRISAAGAILWPAGGVPVCAASGDQSSPAIVTDTHGGALIAWLDQRAGSAEVFAQRITAAGSASWTANGVPVCTSFGVCEAPVGVVDGSGGLIVTWADGRGANFDIYAQRVNDTGAAQWLVNGALICGAGGDQRFPALSDDGTGGAVLAWQDARNGNLDIFAQRISSAGASAWTANGVAICSDATSQVTPSVQSDLAGGAFIGWSDARAVANGMDVYGQRVSSSGATQWSADGVLLSDGVGNQDLPRVVANGLGGAVVAWRDSRSGTSTDIYSQRVDGAGAVTGPCPTESVILSPGGTVAATSSPGFYNFPQADFYWAGVGVRTDSTTDWDLETYHPNSLGFAPYPVCFGDPLAASYRSSGVDFVLGNFNIGQTWPDEFGVRISRYSGAGTGSLEWDAGVDLMSHDCGTGGACGAKSGNNWTGVLDVWDLFLFEGQTYTFDFTRTGTGDIKVLLFEPGPGGTYFVPRSAAVFETSNRFTVFTVPGVLPPPPTLPTLRVYGVVFVNDNGLGGTYLLRANAGASVGVEGGPVPTATAIHGLRPNPSPGQVEIDYALEKPGSVGFQVFDMAGRAVSEIAPHHRTAGTWSVKWDGRGASGQALAAGVYFVQMKVDGVRTGMSRIALVR